MSANHYLFNEEDVKDFFAPPPPRPTVSVVQPAKPVLRSVSPVPWRYFFGLGLEFIGLFISIFIISYSVVNAPALIAKMRYFWQVEYRNQNWGADFNAQNIVVAKADSTLIIPEIKVEAPIIWNVPADKVIDELQRGVAHYQGTALPGQKGNVFIMGHSSYYSWAAGDYKEVFALLDKLSAGDKIYLTYQGETLTYQVTDRVVVEPEDLSVLNQTDDYTLSLMTCVPIGTNLRRLVVIAKQIPTL